MDNAVAYHTTMPFRFQADSAADRSSREKARMDTILANYIAQTQRLNAVFAEALYMAMAYGSCPVHAYWRDDLTFDPYEPIYAANSGMQGMRRGIIDAFAGDPFDTVYNPGAKRNSVQWMSYGRVLPAEMVRKQFEQVLASLGVSLEGSTRLPSASRFQRTVRRWRDEALATHGSAGVDGGRDAGEELIALVCREVAPGVESDYPDGRLTVVAMQGASSTDPQDAARNRAGDAVLLHDGPLPAGRISAVRLYSHQRFDDVLGKPFVGDLDDQQVDLNQYLSLRKEKIRRLTRAPFLAPDGLEIDGAVYDDDVIMEFSGQSAIAPQFLRIPTEDINALNQAIADKREAMFRLGGYQAASRGESKSGDAAAKVVALARADDTIHGPVNQRFQETVCDFMQLCWALFKTYADVPWVIDIAGDEYGDIAEPYLDSSRVSDRPPAYRLVSGFGATPETRAQALLNLVVATGADGQPLMRTSTFKKAYPDPTLFADEADPKAMLERRAMRINEKIRKLTAQFRKENGLQPDQPLPPQWALMAGQQVFQKLQSDTPLLRDDNPQIHVTSLSEITQDESEDPIAREAAKLRQGLYYDWMAQIVAQQNAQRQQQDGGQEGQRASRGAAPAPKRQNPAGGTQTSDAMSPEGLSDTVQQLTNAAAG